jgi:hypothetical protein
MKESNKEPDVRCWRPLASQFKAESLHAETLKTVH